MTARLLAIAEDTIYRFYSMTKPITTVAAMMLFEEGRLRLDHELYRYIPEFADVMVYDGGSAKDMKLKKPDRPIMVHDLMIHTSGLTYAFLFQNVIDAHYRAEGIDYAKFDGDLEAFCKKLATAPLVFSPGQQWNYSNATDVLGRVVEVASGMKLDEFFRRRIFEPLGMADTDFHVPEDKLDRLMACYVRNPNTGEVWYIENSHPDVPESGNRVWKRAADGKLLRKLEITDKDDYSYSLSCDPKTGEAIINSTMLK